jgi:predicted nucleic acid-binding protein
MRSTRNVSRSSCPLRSSSSARHDAADLARRAEGYDALHTIEITPSIEQRAREIQVGLAWRGHHRGPSPTDLSAAAAAESVGAELWHCDRHFDLIGEVTGQPIRRVRE